MHPVLLTLGPVTLYTYGALLSLAFLLATGLAARRARVLGPGASPISPEQVVNLSCLAILAGIAGARAFYVGLHWDAFVAMPQEALSIWRGGLVWYGGFLGGLFAGWGYTRAHRIPFLRAADQLAPFIALAHGIGRVGCFFNGCCYGIPTSAWWGVRFPGHDAPVVPTQLFEAVALLLLAAGLGRLGRVPGRRPGRVFGAYLAGYSLLRFALEYLRGDQAIVWAGLTLQQLMSGAGLAAGGWLAAGRTKGHGAHVPIRSGGG